MRRDTVQWVLLRTDSHDGSPGDSAEIFVPLKVASALLFFQEDRTMGGKLNFDKLWALCEQLGFVKWDMRSTWYIQQVLPPGQQPERIGWQ